MRESILDLRGVILGLRGLIWVPGTDFKPERARFEPERPGGDVHTYGRTDRWTDQWRDTYKEILSCVLQDIGPLELLPKN